MFLFKSSLTNFLSYLVCCSFFFFFFRLIMSVSLCIRKWSISVPNHLCVFRYFWFHFERSWPSVQAVKQLVMPAVPFPFFPVMFNHSRLWFPAAYLHSDSCILTEEQSSCYTLIGNMCISAHYNNIPLNITSQTRLPYSHCTSTNGRLYSSELRLIPLKR